MKIEGRRALVTGAGRGIGRAVAGELHRLGARVIVTDRDGAAARMCAAALPGAEARVLDVTDGEAFAALVVSLEEASGPIDILVNNAGVMALGPFDDLAATDRNQVEVNLFGVIHGVRAVLPHMRARGEGHIVNIASAAGRIPLPGAAVYAATKHAVVGLSESLRMELSGTGVSVSHVMPTLVVTDMAEGLGRMHFPPPVQPVDVGRAAARLILTNGRAAFVPEVIRLAPALLAVLPSGWTDAMQRWLGILKVSQTEDSEARRVYMARAFGGP